MKATIFSHTLNRITRAFTLIEVLIVLIIIGLLASIVVIQVDNALTRAVAEKASTDISLLNSAVTRWRASYPSTDYNTSIGVASSVTTASETVTNDAFLRIRPFLGLASSVDTMAKYNRETSKLYTYEYIPSEYEFRLALVN